MEDHLLVGHISARRGTFFAILAAAMLFHTTATATDSAHPTPRPPSGPTLAVEDTLHALVEEPLPELLVTAPRQTLDEILRHVAEGEAYRDSLIKDQSYTLFIRMVGRDSKKESLDKSEPYFESAMRIYQERPGKQRVVQLKEWSRYDEKQRKDGEESGKVEIRMGGKPDKDDEPDEPADNDQAAADDNSANPANADQSAKDGKIDKGDEQDKNKKKNGISVSVDSDMSEAFVGFAFDPETRSRYRFQIEDRKIIGDQVIYVIAFSPKSPLDALPNGRAWVNTNDFVILREEFSYRDRSPAPLFMESLDSCVLERTRIDGRHWVISRILARVTLTDPVRLMGKMARTKVPKVVDFAMSWTDWIINGDIPDSLFVPAATPGSK